MTTAASAWWWNATLPATGRKPPACPGRASMRWGWRICSWRLRNELAHRHSGTVARQQACCTRSGSVAVCTGRTCSYCRRDVLDQTGKVDELGHDHWPWRRLPVGLHDVEHGAAGHRCTSVAVARHPAQRDRRLAVVRLARRRRAHGGLEPVRWAPGRDRRDHHVVLRWWFRVRLAATLPGHGHVPDTGNVQCTAFKHRAAWSRRSRLSPFRHAGGGCVVTDDCAVLAQLAACRQPLRIGLDPTDGDAVPFRLPSSRLEPLDRLWRRHPWRRQHPANPSSPELAATRGRSARLWTRASRAQPADRARWPVHAAHHDGSLAPVRVRDSTEPVVRGADDTARCSSTRRYRVADSLA